MGTLVVNERIYPISRIELQDSRINFWIGPIDGPVAFPADSEVRVHAPDGTLVAIGPWHLPPGEIRRLRTLSTGDTASVVFPMRIYEVTGWPTVRR